jgi:hypothetical protein
MGVEGSFETQFDDRRISGGRALRGAAKQERLRPLRIARQQALDPFFDVVFYLRRRARIGKTQLDRILEFAGHGSI